MPKEKEDKEIKEEDIEQLKAAKKADMVVK